MGWPPCRASAAKPSDGADASHPDHTTPGQSSTRQTKGGSGVLSAASDETFVSQATSVATGPLRPAQFYIDDAIDGYLRSIRAEALVRKLDVTGSAVVRLALHRLMQELTPQ